MFELHNRTLFLVVNSVVYQTHIGIFNYVKWLLEQINEVKCLFPNTDGSLCSLVCAWDRGEGLGLASQGRMKGRSANERGEQRKLRAEIGRGKIGGCHKGRDQYKTIFFRKVQPALALCPT